MVRKKPEKTPELDRWAWWEITVNVRHIGFHEDEHGMKNDYKKEYINNSHVGTWHRRP